MLYELARGIYAVADLPAVYIPRFKAVVIADIHLGFEEDMASKGIFIPRIQLNKALEMVHKVLEHVEASTLIVAGDIKHRFEGLGKREARDLRGFLEEVVKIFRRVVVVRGNHDTFLAPLCRRLGVQLYDVLWLDKILVVHGHRDLSGLMGFDLVVMGHEHPSISLKDPATGYGMKFPCFLLAPLRGGGYVLVLPATGIYQSGTTISISAEGYLSPILRAEADLENAKPFVIVEGEGVLELPRLKIVQDLLSHL